MDAVLYFHSKVGSAEEAKPYRPLFPSCDVTGLEYKRQYTIRIIMQEN